MAFNVIGIIGAMEVEIQLIIKNMDDFVLEEQGLFKFYKGVLNKKEIIVVKSGAGKVNASSCTQLLIDKYGVDCVINTGIAGAIDENLNICDLVISNDVTYHDVRKGLMRDFFPFKESFFADKNLIEGAMSASKLIENRKWDFYIGRIVTGDRFIDSSEVKKKIMNDYNPMCVEMEGAAIGHVCYLNKIPFLVIRSISDNADDDATISYEEFEKRAAYQSAEIIINMVNLI